MKLEDLKNWHKLTKAEQARLRVIMGDAPRVTKTMAERPPSDPRKPRKDDNG